MNGHRSRSPVDGYTILADAAGPGAQRSRVGISRRLLESAPASDEGGRLRVLADRRTASWVVSRAEPAVPPASARSSTRALVAAAARAAHDAWKTPTGQECDGPLIDRGKVICAADRGRRRRSLAGGSAATIAGLSVHRDRWRLTHPGIRSIDFRESRAAKRRHPIGFEPAFARRSDRICNSLARQASIRRRAWPSSCPTRPPGDAERHRAFRHARSRRGRQRSKAACVYAHMTTRHSRTATAAGAPLGRYTGMSWAYEGEGFYFSDNSVLRDERHVRTIRTGEAASTLP